MRFGYPLLVVGLAALLAVGVRAWAPGPSAPQGVGVLGIFGPSAVAAGERYGVYGGLRLPEGVVEKRFLVCAGDGEGLCRQKGWGAVSGPAEWWGYFGELALEPGRYRVGLTLYAPYGPDGARAVGQVSWDVDAR